MYIAIYSVKIVRVTSIFDLVIWGVLATHNPLGHFVMVGLTVTLLAQV